MPAYARRMQEMFGADPFPFSIEENRPTWEQMLTPINRGSRQARHAGRYLSTRYYDRRGRLTNTEQPMNQAKGHKQQIVRCIRMLEHNGILDYNSHASIRLDGDRMLINIGSCAAN